MQCLILAGGRGTRMRSYDPTVPKALLTVADRPFADWQLQWLASEGVESVVYSIGYMGDAIREFVGAGQRWGLEVEYSQERHGLLGTGGAVRMAAESGALEGRFFLLYGDSYLQVSLKAVDEAYERRGLSALMTVLENAGRWDGSNVVFDGEMVLQYRKGLPDSPPEMRYIDYGLLKLERGLVIDYIPPDEPTDLSLLLEGLSHQGLLGGFEVFERFYEIGSPAGIVELDAFLRKSW
jgi:NDP-sugar pyrophosphorylase family protein